MNTPLTVAHEVRILRAIRRILRAVEMHSKQLKQLQDITTPQLVALLALKEHGELSVKHLSQQLDLSASTTVGVIDRLESKGMVRRTRCAQDRRQVLVSITGTGRTLALQAPSPLQTQLAKALASMPSHEQAEITNALERLVNLFGITELDASALLHSGPIKE